MITQAPFEQSEVLRIGTVDFVSPTEIKVAIEIDAPETVALNTGLPRAFPRVNGYLLVQVDDGFVVGQVEWITVERSAFPKRRGMQDFGLVDLPFPVRRLSLIPVGTLRVESSDGDCVFRRGAPSLPSIGSVVRLPTEAQLRRIVESGDRQRVKIGTSPLAGDARVFIDPNRLFGRHLAVLGNTGSGKSCSVAGLIRWSLEQATRSSNDLRAEHEAEPKTGARTGTQPKRGPNARFIVLDPNGEYARAFSGRDEMKARIFSVNAASGGSALQVPLWFWNSAEWCSFAQASPKTQRPALIHALRDVRDGRTEPSTNTGHEMRRFLRTLVTTIRMEKNSGSPWGQFPRPKSFFEKLEKWKKGLERDVELFSGEERSRLDDLVSTIEELCGARRVRNAHYDFERSEVDALLDVASEAHSAFGGSGAEMTPSDVDAPRPFAAESLLRSVEAAGEMMNVSEHIETLLLRVRALLTNTRMAAVIDGAEDLPLEQWLTDYISGATAVGGAIAVIDLSMVPHEVMHILTAVVARMTFEALQRHMKLHRDALPTVLVMEEAHTFIKRYKEDVENQDAASICCQVFERIAREGRKFGLGLVLSSQRPSELSQTVLSQCNTFLLHRITNDRDQELVNKLVPDTLRGLLHELPSLPSQHAILLGWASELPVLVRMNDLPKAHQPRSDDPDFWEVWTGRDDDGNAVARNVDWKRVADDWQGLVPGAEEDSK